MSLDSLQMRSIYSIIESIPDSQKKQIILHTYLSMDRYEDPIFNIMEYIANTLDMSLEHDNKNTEEVNGIRFVFSDRGHPEFDLSVPLLFDEEKGMYFDNAYYYDGYEINIAFNINSFKELFNLLKLFNENGGLDKSIKILHYLGYNDLYSYDEIAKSLYDFSEDPIPFNPKTTSHHKFISSPDYSDGPGIHSPHLQFSDQFNHQDGDPDSLRMSPVYDHSLNNSVMLMNLDDEIE